MSKKAISIVLGILIFCGAAAGCGEEPNGPGKWDTFYDTEVPLDGGGSVPCVVFDGHKAGGLSCDWSENAD